MHHNILPLLSSSDIIPAKDDAPETQDSSKQIDKNQEAGIIIDDGGISGPNPLEQGKADVEIIDTKPENEEEIEPAGVGTDEEAVVKRVEQESSVVDAISSQGAVVALALGLAITAILLIFVGCRLRNMKRRLRKGRPMNSNEADYLINGMYL